MAVSPRLMTVAASLKAQRGAHLVPDSDCYEKRESTACGMSIPIQNEYDLHTTKNTGKQAAL